MKGQRWEIKNAHSDLLLAELNAWSINSRQANRIGKTIATMIRFPVSVSLQTRPAPNPTLVHHGLAGAASWHIVTEDHQPYADLYYNLDKPHAARIARFIANLLGAPVLLLDNFTLGQPKVLAQHPKSYIASATAGAGVRAGRNPHRPEETPAHVVRGFGAQKRWLVREGGDEVWKDRPGPPMPVALAVTLSKQVSGSRVELARGRTSNRRRRNPRSSGEVDQDAARELELFIENDSQLYFSQHMSILKNLWRKMVKGTYDHEKAIKLWMYLVVNGGKKYARQFSASERDWSGMFNIPTREAVARSLAETGRRALENREYAWQGPKARPNPKRPSSNPKGRKNRRRNPHRASRAPWQERFEAMVGEAADLWVSKANRLAMMGMSPTLYLYFRPSSGAQDGALYWITQDETPDPLWQLARNERIGNQWSNRAQIAAKVHEIARRLPIIAPEGNPRGYTGAITTAGKNAMGNPKRRSRSRYRHIPVGKANPLPRSLDPRSIRTVRRGKTLIRVGCPKGHWHGRAKAGRQCDLGMRAFEKLRPNPSELARARETYREWSELEPGKITKMKAPPRVPKVMAKLGDLVSVVYRSDKYDGKAKLYEHKFKRPLPVLGTDPDGRHAHIVGGNYKVTGDGLVN